MDIPASCQPWEAVLAAGSDDTRAILANVREEKCVKPDPQALFFTGLAAEFHPDAPPDAITEARRAARQTVKDAKGHLLCLGGQTEDGRFGELVRLQRPSSLNYSIPKDRLESAFGGGAGFTPEMLSKIDRDVIATFLEGYDGPVDTSNEFGITWGADMAEVGPVAATRPAELRNRLGLSGWEDEDYVLLLAYTRTQVAGGLHAPRIFEGIDSPAFRLATDCNATVGRTRPLSGDPANGFSEVVHLGCRVRPSRFEAIMLNE